MKKVRWIIIVAILACALLAVYKVRSQETTSQAQWPEFDKWLEWKISTNLTAEQKTAIECLQKSGAIFNEAFHTECVYPDSKYGHPDIKEAIKIVENAIDKLKKIPCPKECIHYKELCIENLRYTLKYQQLRLEYGDGTEEFRKRHRELELSFIDSGVGPAKFAEYFAVMKRIGLFDNMEQEYKALGLK